MSELLKIAFVRSSYTDFGGAEQMALKLLHTLERCQSVKEIDLLTWPHQNWPIRSIKINICEVGKIRGNRYFKKKAFNRDVKQYLNSKNYDRVISLDQVDMYTHLHAGGGTHKNFLKQKWMSASKLKKLFDQISPFHQLLLYYEKKSLTSSKLAKVHACSDMVREDIISHYGLDGSKLVVIPNGLDWERVSQSYQERESIKKRLLKAHHLSDSVPYLLFLGSGFERKGLSFVLKGLACMKEKYQLLVVGKGNSFPFQMKINQLGLKNRVHFLGAQKDGWHFSALCKAFVLPSVYEPFGMAAAECQAMGLPALVSKNTGYRECMQNHKTGVVVEDFDDAKIKEGFIELEKMIETPSCNSDQIRESVRFLDERMIMQKMLSEFLQIKDAYC